MKMICIWSSWCHCHPPHLASLKSRMVYLSGAGLPRPLNGSSSSSSSSSRDCRVCVVKGEYLEEEDTDRSELALPGHQLQLLKDAIYFSEYVYLSKSGSFMFVLGRRAAAPFSCWAAYQVSQDLKVHLLAWWSVVVSLDVCCWHHNRDTIMVD